MEAKNPIRSFIYDFTEADYMRFNKYHYRKFPSGKKMLLAARIFGVIPLFFMFFIPILRGGAWYQILYAGIMLTLLSIIWLVTTMPLVILNTKLYVMIMKRSGKLPFGKNVQLDFYENYICETTEMAETRFKYSSIEYMGVDKNAVYLYYNAMQALVILRSVFESKEDEDAFLEFIRLQLSTAIHST